MGFKRVKALCFRRLPHATRKLPGRPKANEVPFFLLGSNDVASIRSGPGDSGGPLLTRKGNDWVLYGVVSSGRDISAGTRQSIIYVDIKPLLKEIDSLKKRSCLTQGLSNIGTDP